MTEDQAKPNAVEQDLPDEQLEDVAGGFRLHQAGVNPVRDDAASLPIKTRPFA